MRLAALATVATVACAHPFLPDLTSADWAQIQSGFSAEGLGSLASDFASGIVDKINGAQKAVEEYGGDDTQKTIWQQINDDSDNYSKLIKILNVSGGRILLSLFCNQRLTRSVRGRPQEDNRQAPGRIPHHVLRSQQRRSQVPAPRSR